MKRILLTLCLLIASMTYSINAKDFPPASFSHRGLYGLTLYEFIFPLDNMEIRFGCELQLTKNCEISVLLGDEVISSPRTIEISNWHNADYTSKQGTLRLTDFSCNALPLGQTYTLRIKAGSIADLDDVTLANKEISFPLVVPANLNHYVTQEPHEFYISEDSPKIFTGCNLWIGTEVDPIGSPVVYLQRNGETIGKYPIDIQWQDWDVSSARATFPAVTLDEGAEYTLVLPANSFCSLFREDLTNDELTIVIQEGSSAITEVELTDSDRNQPIYDLTGRRVLNPGKGLYIINGRKTLLR